MEKTKSKKISGASLRNAFEEIIWPRRKLVGIGLVLITINRLAGLVLPASTQYLFDDVIPNADMDLFLTLIVVLGSAIAIQAVTSYALTMLLSVEAQHLIANLRAQVQKHVLNLPIRDLRQHEVRRPGITHHGRRGRVCRNLVGTGLVQLVGGNSHRFRGVRVPRSASTQIMTACSRLGPSSAPSRSSRPRRSSTLRPAFRERGKHPRRGYGPAHGSRWAVSA